MQAESRPIITEVVVVGAGIAGLSAANALLAAGVPFKCIEAHGVVGGRVRHVEGFVPWSRTPLGAEFLHGDGTSMYKYCEDNGIRTRMLYSWAQGNAPMEHQKNANGVGMYFFLKSGQSVRTDRVAGSSEWSDILRLHNVFDAMGTFPLKKNDSRNLLEYARDNGVSERCIKLAEAGFANTLCSSLSRLGLQEVSWLESQWDEDEGEGDYRLDGSLQVVVDKMASAVSSDISVSDPVVSVDYSRPGQIVVKTSRKKEFHCRYIILTVPTTVIRDGDIHFNPPMPEEKIQAARAIPMNNCVKIICRFKRRFWPSDVHGAIIADGLVPEVWFDHVGRVGEVAITGTSESATAASDIQAASLSADAICTATGFCSAAWAANVAALPQTEAAKQFLAQLDAMFGEKISSDYSLRCPASASCSGFLIYDWSKDPYIRGGYSSPESGCNWDVRSTLRKPIGASIFFAGEALDDNTMSVHGAYDSGVRPLLRRCRPFLALTLLLSDRCCRRLLEDPMIILY